MTMHILRVSADFMIHMYMIVIMVIITQMRIGMIQIHGTGALAYIWATIGGELAMAIIPGIRTRITDMDMGMDMDTGILITDVDMDVDITITTILVITTATIIIPCITAIVVRLEAQEVLPVQKLEAKATKKLLERDMKQVFMVESQGIQIPAVKAMELIQQLHVAEHPLTVQKAAW